MRLVLDVVGYERSGGDEWDEVESDEEHEEEVDHVGLTDRQGTVNVL